MSSSLSLGYPVRLPQCPAPSIISCTSPLVHPSAQDVIDFSKFADGEDAFKKLYNKYAEANWGHSNFGVGSPVWWGNPPPITVDDTIPFGSKRTLLVDNSTNIISIDRFLRRCNPLINWRRTCFRAILPSSGERYFIIGGSWSGPTPQIAFYGSSAQMLWYGDEFSQYWFLDEPADASVPDSDMSQATIDDGSFHYLTQRHRYLLPDEEGYADPYYGRLDCWFDEQWITGGPCGWEADLNYGYSNLYLLTGGADTKLAIAFTEHVALDAPYSGLAVVPP